MNLVCKLYHSLSARVMVSTLFIAILLVPLVGCSLSGPIQMITIDSGIPADARQSPVVGSLPDNTPLHARVTFKIDPAFLQKMQQQQIKPEQPSHLEQFANKLGVDDATYQKFKDFFNAKGIALKLSKLRTHLAIDASAKTLAKVFQTKFVTHKYHDQTFYAPDPAKPPQAPKFLMDSIDVITGLDNYSSPPSHQLTADFHTAGTRQSPAADCSPADQTLLPKQVAHVYGFDKLWNRGVHGENMTINLVEIDGSYSDDIQNYFQCIDFKGKFSIVNVDGHPQEALGESTLDIQMVAGLARSSNIKVYQTDLSNANEDIWVHINDELQQLIDDNLNNANAGNVVSISLGASEGELTGADMRAIDSSIKQLTQVEHMAVFVASGDCGAFTSRVYGQLSVSFPASDPWAVSVGGTFLQVDNNANRATEQVWSDGSNPGKCQNSWGSGGGNSAVFKRMNWQDAAGVNTQFSRGMRQLPDVSAVAYALAVYYKGQWGAVGGTSAAAPIWATGLAMVNQNLKTQYHTFKFSPDLFYTVAKNGNRAYYDVTRGDNLYYRATSGWDYATGLGTPNLSDFYDAVAHTIK